jgi:hypothetical protein
MNGSVNKCVILQAVSDEMIRLTPSLRRGRPELGPNCPTTSGRDCWLCRAYRRDRMPNINPCEPWPASP